MKGGKGDGKGGTWGERGEGQGGLGGVSKGGTIGPCGTKLSPIPFSKILRHKNNKTKK